MDRIEPWEAGMFEPMNLNEAEKKTFRTAYDDGLWDLFLGSIFLMFAVAPFLSVYLGDFWSSAVFLPVWLIIYLTIRWVKKNVVLPRVGIVKIGPDRTRKLKRFTVVMLIINVLALILGFVAAVNVGRISGYVISMFFGIELLVGFSLAGYLLGFNRLYVYGILSAVSPPVGEWLWVRRMVTHHGFPVTFGTVSAIMVLTGLCVFARMMRKYSPDEDQVISENG